MSERLLSEAMLLIAQLAEIRGLVPGHGDLLRMEVGPFVLELNRSRGPLPSEFAGAVDPFHAAVWENGWPVASLHSFGGEAMPGAEDRLCAALKAEIRAAGKVPLEGSGG